MYDKKGSMFSKQGDCIHVHVFFGHNYDFLVFCQPTCIMEDSLFLMHKQHQSCTCILSLYSQEDDINHFNDVATQTEWPQESFDNNEIEKESTEHNYSFSMFVNQFEDKALNLYIENLKTHIETLSAKLERASQNISELQEQIDYLEGNRFTLDKIKDDNDAISFYTGFQNYGVFNSVF